MLIDYPPIQRGVPDVLPALSCEYDAYLIADRIGKTLRIPTHKILSYGREKSLAHARQWLMWELRKLNYTFSQIGSALGRDHTTIMHGVKAHEARMKGTPNV